MVEDVQSAMDEFEDTFETSLQGKIHCKLTGHDLPYKIEEFRKYVASKKFIRAYELQKFLNTHGEHFEDIGKNLYGCKLTLRTIANDPYSLNHHVNGIKFKNALKKHQEKALEGGDPEVKSDEVVEEEMPTESEEPVKAKASKKAAGKGRKVVFKEEIEEDMPSEDEEPVKAKAPKKAAGKKSKVVAKKEVEEDMPSEDDEEIEEKAATKRTKSSGAKRNAVKKSRNA